ncbi:subtilisin-like protein [Dichomitus squalens]|uniref:tripeptidyl-peptidase II n=1 Tax=Dichomitus squalens TaxID=114155 RepID=A0A4Q9ME37_9APHY|nr:subtilisin-like protein [Dichomitus squalens]
MLAAGLLFPSLISHVLGGAVPRSDLKPRSLLHSIPSGYSPSELWVPGDDVIRLTVGIPPKDASSLYATLLDVSDPSSSNYGRHLTRDEVAQLSSPDPESVKAITDWLGRYGITPEQRSHSGDTLSIVVSSARADALLAANFTAYTHSMTNTTIIRTLSYSLPAYLHDHIAFVYPTTQFDPPARRQAPPMKRVDRRAGLRKTNLASAASTSCTGAVTPKCLQALYGIPSSPANASGNSLYVSSLGGTGANPNDLQTFLTKYRPDILHGSFAVLPITESQNTDAGDDEGNCDTQYTVGLATNVPVTYVVAGDKENGVLLSDLLDTANFLLSLEKPSLVLTTSYVFDEPAADDQDLQQMARAICNAYAQLGARGTSVVFAAGDGGAAGGMSASDGCGQKVFIPTFPSTCPYVTSVGSTDDISPEVAASFSSGGFSNLFPRPSYQDSAVNAFLDRQRNANAGLYNSSGRAYPDVATQGVNFAINVAGKGVGFSGTSASSPTFASIVALINDRLLASGKSPLGFLNPMLYSKGVAAFNDVTKGDNGDARCDAAGFNADTGWDAVTGLGTPDYDKLLDVVTGHSFNKLHSGAARVPSISRLLYTIIWMFTAVVVYRHIAH